MQNQEEFSKNEANSSKLKETRIFSNMHQKLKSVSTQEARTRAIKLACVVTSFALALMLSGSRMAFETYPLAISLICGMGRYYFPAFLGALFGGFVNEVGREYIFAYIAVFGIRLFISMPFMPSLSLQKTTESVSTSDDEEYVLDELEGESGGVLYKLKRFFCKLLRIPEIEGEKKARRGFFENVGLRLIISATGGFVCGLFVLIQTDFSYYSLSTLLFLTFICPLLGWLFSGLFDKNIPLGGAMSTLSIAAAMLFSTYAARELAIFTLTLAPMFAMLFTLISCKLRGIASGLLMAALLGIMFDIRFVPMLMISCIAYFMLREIKLSIAMASVVGVCLVWSYYFSDIDSFVAVLPPTLIALPLFLMFDKYIKSTGEENFFIHEENKYFAKSVSEESKNQAVRAKVSSLSEAFSSLSKVINSLSDKFSRPDMLGIRAITDEGFSRVCEGCPNFDVCYGAEYNRTVEAAGKITSALHRRGHVDGEDLGESFRSVCVRQKKLVEQMNSLCSERTQSILLNHTTGIFSSSYDDIKEILQDAIETGNEEYECDTEVGAKIYEYLKNAGYGADGVVVCGKRCKRVMLKGVKISGDAQSEGAASLCKTISEIAGVRMIGPVFEVGDDGTLMLFSAKPRFSAICSSGRRAMFESRLTYDDSGFTQVNPFEESINEKRDELCGDVTNAFLTDTSYFYSLISDGMGSGMEAAFSAGICSVFCEKMLMAGNRSDITIRMLNNFLRSENSRRGSECSVTVDLFELDLMLGIASFIKSGAAPTYILRSGEVYKISSKTMPVGIIKNPDIKVTKFDMKAGDLVLMMSDGVCGEGEDCEWIIEALCNTRLPENMAAMLEEGEKFADAFKEKIFDLATEKMKNTGKFDDISVSVVLII